MGRPSDYTQATADEICSRIALGESLRSICRDDAMPHIATVQRWLSASNEFREQYAHAREMQADSMFDEMLEIADDGSNDWMDSNRDGGDRLVDHEYISRSKLRVDTRKWMLARMSPKKYGDATSVKLSGDAQNPLALLVQEISGNTLKPK